MSQGHLQQQRDYFNALSTQWDSYVNHDARKIDTILSAMALSARGRIMDVGCGTGVLVPFLQKYNPALIVEMDISDGMLYQNRLRHGDEGIQYLCCDAADASLALKPFDAVICYSMFPHFLDKPAAISSLARRLKPEGKLMIAHSQSWQTINGLHTGLGEVVKGHRLPSQKDISAWMQEAGLLPYVAMDDEEIFFVCGRLPK